MNRFEYKYVFDKLYNPLCNFCLQIVKNDDDAEDIVQQVFLNIWKSKKSVPEGKDLEYYIFKCVRNESFKWIKKKNNREDLLRRYSEFDIGDNAAIEKLYDTYMLKELISNSLRHLAPKCREIFELHKMEGLSYVEIAKYKNISIKTVESQLSKAYKILRVQLGKYFEK